MNGDTGIFDKKTLKEFSNKVQKVFNLLTISRKIKVIGSAGLKNIRYVNDYDIQETYTGEEGGELDFIYKMFKEKFDRCKKDPTCFITDLKCGEDCNGEPLRWNEKDIKRGTKKMSNGRVVTFQECILMKATFKLDVVKIIDSVFTEFSDNYLIKLGNKANFFPYDVSLENLKNNILHSYDDYFYTCQNYFKGLKRAFSYYLLDGKGKNETVLKKLMGLFNSHVGKFYQMKGQIGTLLLVLENANGFRNPKISDIKRNVKLILDLNPPSPAKELLTSVVNSSSKSQIITALKKAEDELFDIVNEYTVDFIKKNPDVLIY